MKVVTDIERIGDHAADIAEIIPHLVTVRKEGDPAVSQAIAMGKKAHQMILDALEFGSRDTPDSECGGFLSAAGLTYEIDSTVQYTGSQDDKGVWQAGPTGEYRVRNVKIYNKASGTYEPLDESKTYALAGMNYTLRNLGDGFAMFDGAELIKDYVSEDYLVMSSYAMMFGGADGDGLPHLTSANSPLADYPGYLLDYENPYGAGRITIL